jgi:hypothetical protein
MNRPQPLAAASGQKPAVVNLPAPSDALHENASVYSYRAKLN